MSELENNNPQHIKWMREAIKLAQKAQECGEVPVGALITKNDTLISSAYNQPITKHDPTAHAEIQALQQAGKILQNYRLNDTVLYITLEPCAMCAGAIVHARIGTVVFGAYDHKTGVAGSAGNIFTAEFSNHKPKIIGGTLEKECSLIIRNFFQARRQK